MDTPKNTAVATTERHERSARPHRPWPLVQPEPMRVPKPTSSPPMSMAGGDASTSTGAGPRYEDVHEGAQGKS
jgi:hypothetical protein